MSTGLPLFEIDFLGEMSNTTKKTTYSTKSFEGSGPTLPQASTESKPTPLSDFKRKGTHLEEL
jgi:hypothetical protein